MSRALDNSPDILAWGEWRRVGLVLRWVPGAPPPVTPAVNVTSLLACPTCHAKVGQTCRTCTGHATTMHGSRLTARLCRCGAVLAPRRRYCDPCRDAALQEAKNASARRRRAERRAAA